MVPSPLLQLPSVLTALNSLSASPVFVPGIAPMQDFALDLVELHGVCRGPPCLFQWENSAQDA